MSLALFICLLDEGIMNETKSTPSLIDAGEEDWIFQMKTKTFSSLDGTI